MRSSCDLPSSMRLSLSGREWLALSRTRRKNASQMEMCDLGLLLWDIRVPPILLVVWNGKETVIPLCPRRAYYTGSTCFKF